MSKERQQERLAILRQLWTEGYPIDHIAERLRIAPCTVSQLAHAAGLRSRRANRQEPVVENP